MTNEKIITKFINNAFINALEISKEEGMKYYPLYKSFKERNYSVQEEECKKLGLSKPQMYGVYTHTKYFGEFLAKILKPGRFESLWEMDNSILGVYHSAPRWDDTKGGFHTLQNEEGEEFSFRGEVIFPRYYQVKDLRTGRYIPILEVFKRLHNQGRSLPEEFMEFFYNSIDGGTYSIIEGDSLKLLLMSKYNGVLPKLEAESEVDDPSFMPPVNPITEALEEYYKYSAETLGWGEKGERYDNAIEPEVWERNEEEDFERDLFSPNLEKVLKSLKYLENSSLPKAKEVKNSYWSKDGLNIRLLWRDLQQRGYAETLTWEGWEDDPDKGSYEEKTLWSLKALRSLTKEELKTLLEMRDDALLTQVGYASLQVNPCKVYTVDPKNLQKGGKHEVRAHVEIPWGKEMENDLSKS